MAITLAMREAVRAEGMLGGDGLFTVRASQGMRIVKVADEGPVAEGEILVKSTSPEIQAEIDDAQFVRELLEQHKEILAMSPLPDSQLIQRLENSLAALRQERNNLLLTLPNFRDVAARDAMQRIFQQEDAIGKIENDIQLAKGDLRQAMAKRGGAREQLKRERELSRKWNLSTNDLNEREKEVYSLDEEIKKHESRIATFEQQRQRAKTALEDSKKKVAEQGGEFNKTVELNRKELAEAQKRCDELKEMIYVDTKKAELRREHELGECETKIKQADAQLIAKRNKLEVRAPYSGQVVYRHPSPGAALNYGPVLVLSPPEGLRFHFRLPESQVDALRQAGTISIELEETSNSIEQRFPGKFLQATPLARDPGMCRVDLECQAPPETVASLAEAKPIKARFSWRPPVMNMWPFPLSLALIGFGIVGFVASHLSGWKPSWPKAQQPISDDDDEDSIVNFTKTPVKEGDTIEARDTIPERPLLPHVPREIPTEQWEHPVGIRLREAIIREEVTVEMIAAVETAIEQKRDAIIVPLREALRRAPSVPSHARQLLDRLNNSETGDEMRQMEQRCLAQRLTFLLYTIGIEIPSEVQRSDDFALLRS